MGEMMCLKLWTPSSVQVILCLVLGTSGAFSTEVDSGSGAVCGRRKDEMIISCLESTLWDCLEHRTLLIDSCAISLEEFFCRITSIDEEKLPMK